MHEDSLLLLPTLPLNWCIWANPNLSAHSITIIVASGTSTPTSITVVATRILLSPDLNSFIDVSLSIWFCFPWINETLMFLKLFFKKLYLSLTAIRSEFSESSIRGQTQYTNAPALIALSIEDNTSAILVCDKTYVLIDFLPIGFSLKTEISISP